MNVLFQKLLWCSTGSSLLLQIHFLNSNGRLTVNSVKAAVNYGTRWDAVGAVVVSLVPSCFPPAVHLTWLQTPTPADSLVHLRSFQDRLLPPLVATSFLPHCRHAWFQICLERWLFLHCSFLFVSTCLHSILLCSSCLTCLASPALRTCLLQPQLSFVVFSWIKSLELLLSVLVHTWVLCLWNSYVNATSLFANVYPCIYSVQRTCKF